MPLEELREMLLARLAVPVRLLAVLERRRALERVPPALLVRMARLALLREGRAPLERLEPPEPLEQPEQPEQLERLEPLVLPAVRVLALLELPGPLELLELPATRAASQPFSVSKALAVPRALLARVLLVSIPN